MNNFIMSETESRFEGLAGTPLPKKNFPSVPSPPPPGLVPRGYQKEGLGHVLNQYGSERFVRLQKKKSPGFKTAGAYKKLACTSNYKGPVPTSFAKTAPFAEAFPSHLFAFDTSLICSQSPFK